MTGEKNHPVRDTTREAWAGLEEREGAFGRLWPRLLCHTEHDDKCDQRQSRVARRGLPFLTTTTIRPRPVSPGHWAN